MMFKQMGGNEILLNLENANEMRDSELISALLELGKRDKNNDHDWTVHKWVRAAIADLTGRVGSLSAKHLTQVPIALNRLRYEDTALYNLLSNHIIRLLHKYTSRDLVRILRIFSPPTRKTAIDNFDEQFRENQLKNRADQEFFERIIAIIPYHCRTMNHHEIVDVMEVCNAKKVGSERLFTEYLYFYVEKHINKFSFPLYIRSLRVLGDQ